MKIKVLSTRRQASKPMGKQVQFFMTHEDEKNFLASFSQLAPVRLVCQTFSPACPR